MIDSSTFLRRLERAGRCRPAALRLGARGIAGSHAFWIGLCQGSELRFQIGVEKPRVFVFSQSEDLLGVRIDMRAQPFQALGAPAPSAADRATVNDAAMNEPLGRAAV